MRYLDRDSSLSRFPALRDHLSRILYNRQIRGTNQSDPPLVTESIKIDDRPKFEPLHKEGELSEFSARVLENYSTEDEPYRFQARAWEAIDDAVASGTTESVLLTAPTGHGKTGAFREPILTKLCESEDFEQVILVYPRTALLRDQFETLLGKVHRLNQQGNNLSIGAWFGGTARQKRDVVNNPRLVDQRNNRFELASCWEDEGADASPLRVDSQETGYQISCEDPTHSHTFSDQEVILYRERGLRNNGGTKTNIIVTTLESLELFSVKPNYNIIQSVDTLLFDEVHLYQAIYGTHALNIIQNIRKIHDYHDLEMPLLIGSSATLADPETFAERLYGIDSDALEVVEARASDDVDGQTQADMAEADGQEYFQFLKSSEDIGVGSQFIQQAMLYERRILPSETDSGKLLSFIDSLSQINQRFGQLRDADQNQRLWEHHITGHHRSWTDLEPREAWNEDTSDFYRGDVTINKVHSKSRVRPDELAETDHILASPLLEVGIDLPDIQAVAQYRPPWNASSFIQRIGRAHRNWDEDSYVMMFLADEPNDINLYYRASRFIETDIRTPLNEENQVISSIHQKYIEFYRTIEPIWDNLDRDDDERFFQEYVRDVLGYTKLYEFVTAPKDTVEDIIGEPIGNIQGQLTDWNTFTAISGALGDVSSDIQERLNIDADIDVVQPSDSFNQIAGRVEYLITEYDDLLERIGASTDEIDDAEASLRAARETYEKADRVPPQDAEEKIAQFRETVRHLRELGTDIMMISGVRQSVRSSGRTLNEEILDVVQEIRDLEGQIEDEEFEELHDRSRKVYHLQQALEAFEAYQNIRFWAFGSLHAVKGVLRTGYHLERAMDESLGGSDDELPYVPENYFGNNASAVTISKSDDEEEVVDKTKLFSQYAPYRAVYAEDSQKMYVIVPDFDPSEDEPQFDYRSIAESNIEGDILEPESIKAEAVDDESGERSQGVIRYCPVCYDLLTKTEQCSKHGDSQFGKIHSEPHIKTQFGRYLSDATEFESEPNSVGDLTVRSGLGQIVLDRAELEITPAVYYEDRFVMRYDLQETKLVRSDPDAKLGVSLPTKGIEYDIGPIRNDIRENREEWEDLIIGDRDTAPEVIGQHTAAHLLLILVSDVSGVNPSQLHYGYRESQERIPDRHHQNVYVFEEAEGGQGVVDLVIEELRDDDHARIKESLKRVCFNEQLEAERFCRNEGQLSRIVPEHPEEGETTVPDDILEDAAEQYLSNRPLTDTQRLQEELRSVVQKIWQIDDETSLDTDDVIALKSALASSRLNGAGREEALNEHSDMYNSDHENRIRSLLCPPDVDYCRNNLQFSGCREKDQDDVLSYQVLQKILTDYILGENERELFGTTH
jgi:superfamily II DNA or RNA helicase/CHASE3 domain sensor protein